jgi:hypothetical protein
MQLRSSDKTVKEYGTMVRDTEGKHPADGRVLDPRFGKAEHSVKGQRTTSIQEDFVHDAGLYFDCNVPGTEREETGIQAIRNLMSWDKHAPLSELNRPKLSVQAHCTNTIAMLEKSVFVPPNARDPMILKEELGAAWKDPRDCLRYGILYDIIYDKDDDQGYIDLDELGKDDEYEI